MRGRLSNCSIVSLFLELLEFSEDRHPWESVEEKLNAIRYELVVVCVDHSSVHPSFRPALFVSTPVPQSLPSCPLSVFTSHLAPVSILASLPFTSPRPSVANSLPSSLSLPLPFFRLSLLPFLCLSIPPTLPSSLRSCLSPFLLFSLPTPLALPFLHSPMTFHSVTVFLSCEFGFYFDWTIVLILFPFSET